MVNQKRVRSMDKVNLVEKLRLFADYWNPRVVGALNGQHVKLVKLKGEFVWHRHDDGDEMFLVLAGQMRIELKDGSITLGEGEFFIVPKGIEHRSVAPVETHVLLFEPATTVNTGDVTTEHTVERPERI